MILPKLTGIKRQVFISICLYLGQLICGYSVAWTGPVIPMLRDLDKSPLPYLLSESQLSLVASFIYLGIIPGPYIMGWISNTLGRKPCLIFAGVTSAFAYIMLATAKHLFMLYLGRIITGAATGIIVVMNMVYIGEIASANIRGILLVANGIFTTLGTIILYAAGPFLTYHGTTYVGLAVCVAFIIGTLMIPESPIFYIIKGNDKEVKRVLEGLGRLEDIDKLSEIKYEYEKTINRKDWKDWVELVSLRSNRKALFIVVTINILQQCSGVVAIVFFSAAIFEMAGSALDSNISMVIIGCFQLSGSIITPIFIDKIGRKIILLISSAVCSLSMFALGLYFYLDYIGNAGIDNIRWFPLLVLILFFIGYDSGIGIIPNALIGEVFTTNTRSKGSAVAITSAWLVGFGITTAFGALLETVGGHSAFWFFSSTCAFTFLFTLIFIPETKGRNLIEIQESLSK